MTKINGSFTSIEQVASQYLNKPVNQDNLSNSNGISFQDVLKRQIEGVTDASTLKFSKHAAARLENRGIEMTDEQSIRLEEGVMKAQEKGIKDSLVIVDQLAFIVNVPNQTVITAMDQSQADDNIFTNIDGAVIV